MSDPAAQFLAHLLWYDRPASEWTEALPVGNGRLGAMVFGGVEGELLQLNDDTLYSGEPDTRSYTPDITVRFAEVRDLFRQGKYAEAEAIIASDWLGTTHTSYQPLGDLRFFFEQTGPATSYRRELDLGKGILSVRYEAGGVRYRREVFCSQPDDVLVYRMEAESPGALNFSAALESPHPGTDFRVERGMGLLVGRAPVRASKRSLGRLRELGDTHKYPELFDESGAEREGAAELQYESGEGARGMRFAVAARLLAEDGNVEVGAAGWRVSGATRATLVLSSGTSFAGFRRSPSREGVDAEARPRRALANLPTGYEELRRRHEQDFQTLFGRMDIRLGERVDVPTDQRRAEFARGGDPQFAALHLQYARYLTISASRPGTQPMNLQGIWNAEVIPPWNCGCTLNINTEMNYWLTEPANLPMCHEPMIALAREAAEKGRELAREMFGRNGWVCFHNLGIWRDVQPSDGEVCWAFWPMAQAWLSQHAWLHYQYSLDREFLRREAYPLLRGAAEFFLEWLVEDEAGYLITPVGTSPENAFLYRDAAGAERKASASSGPTMDLALVRECLESGREAAEILGVDAAFQAQLAAAVARLAPYRVGARGQLQEWAEDFEETEVEHRHVSHLYGLHPGRQITAENTPTFLRAAVRSLELRGGNLPGWPAAWKACLWARAREGERAAEQFRLLLGHTYPNLFNAEPFQIDGNLGGPAALLEMLLQSHEGCIEILPALSQGFSEGAIKGVRARGGFELDFSWRNRRLEALKVCSTVGGDCEIRWSGRVARLATFPGSRHRLGGDFNWEEES